MVTKPKLRLPPPIVIFLTVIFFFSGVSALIYQVVWQRLFTLDYGVGFISTTIVVSVYMLGLGLGTLIGGFLAERISQRITAYMVIEILIGLFGIFSIPILEKLGVMTAAIDYKWMAFLVFCYLCIPTFLMGATLPLLSKIINQWIANFFTTLSFLYFVNTIGAALGAILASYVLITLWGLDTAIYIAAGMNILLALSVFLIRKFPPGSEKSNVNISLNFTDGGVWGKRAYLFVFITGFLAIGYEIVWFRLIGVLIKSSVYAFSTILFVYLLGIALGSFLIKQALLRCRVINLKKIFCGIQFWEAIAIAVSVLVFHYMVHHPLLNKPIMMTFGEVLHPPLKFELDTTSFSTLLSSIYRATDIFIWPFYFMFIPTLLMGATFPIIAELALVDRGSEGKAVGLIAFFNIIGNVMGGLVTGLFLLPVIGTERTLLIFVVTGLIFGLYQPVKRISSILGNPKNILTYILISLTCFGMVSLENEELYKDVHFINDENVTVDFEEGREGVVLTKHLYGGVRVANYINGLLHGGRPVSIFYEEAVEGLKYAPSLEKVLVVGFGTGTSVETVLSIQKVARVDLVEINRTLMKNLSKVPVIADILNDRRLRIEYDDIRRYLERNDEKYPLVLMDPLRSTTNYSNNIYSKEFLQLVQKHLSPKGVVVIWMDEFCILPKTFSSVFKHMRIYSDYCLMSNDPFIDDVDNFNYVYDSLPDNIKKYLTAPEYIGDSTLVDQYLQGIPVNHDYKPYSEYYLGRERFYNN